MHGRKPRSYERKSVFVIGFSRTGSGDCAGAIAPCLVKTTNATGNRGAIEKMQQKTTVQMHPWLDQLNRKWGFVSGLSQARNYRAASRRICKGINITTSFWLIHHPRLCASFR
jgi:hypothetical protein